MNTTLEHNRRSGHGLSRRYVAALAGAALATATLLIGAAWQDSASSAAVTTNRPAATVSRAPRPLQYLYIVGSEAEAAALLRASAELDDPFDPRTLSVIVAGSPAGDGFLNTGVEALIQAGFDVRLIYPDLPSLERRVTASTDDAARRCS